MYICACVRIRAYRDFLYHLSTAASDTVRNAFIISAFKKGLQTGLCFSNPS